MAWQPNPQGLQEIVNLFLVSRQATNEQHRQIQEKIVEFNRNPEFNCYLVHIFACLSSAQIEAGEAVRQRAGLLLKNNVKQFWESFQTCGHVQMRHTSGYVHMCLDAASCMRMFLVTFGYV